jgi:hypothetical protein
MYSFDVEVAYATIRFDGISGSVSYLRCVLHGPETLGESPGSDRTVRHDGVLGSLDSSLPSDQCSITYRAFDQ